MGCVQSTPRKPRRAKGVGKNDDAASAHLTPQQAQAAAEAAARAKAQAAQAEKEREEAEKPRRDTAVLKKAGQFDQLHADALRMPTLRDVKVVRGTNSMRLLEGFEQKEAEARAVPQLIKVDEVNVRESRLYDKLREYELKEEKAKAEPRLEKTFVQKERENSLAQLGKVNV